MTFLLDFNVVDAIGLGTASLLQQIADIRNRVTELIERIDEQDKQLEELIELFDWDKN